MMLSRIFSFHSFALCYLTHIVLLEHQHSNVLHVEASLSCACSDEASFCNADAYCETNYRKGSICHPETKICTNPLSEGCLQRLLDDDQEGGNKRWNTRVCNSNDPEDASDRGLCIQSKFNYTEIRIHHSNWESSIFYAWILQIILSEVLGVPATIGLTADSSAASFYNVNNTFDYSPSAYPWEALDEANRVGDCLESDELCAHVFPEVWNGQSAAWTESHSQGKIAAPEGNGMVGKISFYVPAFVADRDPTLVSFFGLRGDENREKLAKSFLRPTTWRDYCEIVSPTNCTEPDDVAERYPGDGEFDNYYAQDIYSGHFRQTEQSNCTANPDTCTGHIVAPPCTWSTNLDAQVYWNKIALESNGPLEPTSSYSYGSMIQIWRAAVETESNVIMWWWKPDATVEEFRGGPGEFQQVLLPEATDKCSDHRISSGARCSADVWERRGEELGSCDSEAHGLQKIIVTSLRTDAESAPASMRNPGYEAITNIKISDLEMNIILKRWIGRGIDTYGYDGREAVCSWVAENIDELFNDIPPTYPRTMDDSGPNNIVQVRAMQAIGGFAAIAVLAVTSYTYKYREARVFVYAQANFCFLILAGLFLSSIAAICYVVEPSLLSCTATQWLAVLGFTLELIPLLVKVAAINRIQQAAKRYKRVNVEARDLYLAVAAFIFVVLIFLLCWTVLDPPTSVHRYVMSLEDQSVVISTQLCASSSDSWDIAALAWIGLLLVMTTVLAVQSRNVPQRFNETKSLVSMVYAHFLFKILGLVVYVLSDALHVYTLPIINSCLLVLDTLVVLAIYFAPKLVEAMRPELESRRGSLFSRPSGRSVNNSSKVLSQASASLALDPVKEVEEDDYEEKIMTRVTKDQTHSKASSSKMMRFDGSVSENYA